MRRIHGVITAAAAAELRAEVGTLNLIKLLYVAPSLVAHSSGHVDFQSYNRHIRLFDG
jgi:hypothetical protein